MPQTLLSSSSSPRNSHELYAPSPGNSSTHLTPSDDDESDDGPSMLADPEAFELQPITRGRDVRRRSGALPLPIPGSRGGDGAGILSRQPSVSSTKSYELYTPDEDRKVLGKLDRRLVGFMALLYCLSFLDRSSELGFSLCRMPSYIKWAA